MHVLQFAMKKSSSVVYGNLRLQQLFHTQAIAPHDPATGSRAPAMNHNLEDRFVNSLADNLDYRHDDVDGEFAAPRRESACERRRSNTQLDSSLL